MEWVTLWNISIFENAVHYNLLKEGKLISDSDGKYTKWSHPHAQTYAPLSLHVRMRTTWMPTWDKHVYDGGSYPLW